MENTVPTLKEIQAERTWRLLVYGSLTLILLILAIRIFTPVPPATERNCFLVSGFVTEVSSPCCEDVVIRLAGDQHSYYINRGLERGLKPEEMQRVLLGKPVELKVIRRSWTPLDPAHLMQPVAEVKLDDRILFTALK